MSIQVYQGYDDAHGRQTFQVFVFGKHRVVQVGSWTMGKKVAMRAFKNAIRLLMRGT